MEFDINDQLSFNSTLAPVLTNLNVGGGYNSYILTHLFGKVLGRYGFLVLHAELEEFQRVHRVSGQGFDQLRHGDFCPLFS